MKKFVPLILAVLFLLDVGCAKSIRYSEEEIKSYPPNIQEHIRKGEVTPGMTQTQVRYSWGSPSVVRTLAPSEDGRSREEWVYKSLYGVFRTRLVFTDGIVTEIISNDPGIKK